MFKQFFRTFASVTVVAVLGIGVSFAQAPKEKKVKDQGEYDLFTQASPATTTDPNKRLAALNSWKEKYPESDFKDDRLKIYLTTYQALGQPVKMWETAKEMLALDPKEINALYWLTLLAESLPVSPDTLSTGEKAAQGLLNVSKPEGVTDDVFGKMKTDFATVGHKTLGFIAVQNKQFDVAEKEYAKSLEANPANAQVSYSLGTTILKEAKTDRYPEAFFHIARAASMTGPGALPPAFQKQADAFLIRGYESYHGQDAAGLKELRQIAVSQPMPPAGFTIKDKNTLESEKEAEFAKNNPQLHFWNTVKTALIAPDGQSYFDSGVKGTEFPPESVGKLKGKLVSMKGTPKPKELVLAIEEGKPEVTLKFETALTGKAEPGTEIEFVGLVDSFTKEPFMLVLTVDDERKAKMTGWPAQAAAPAGARKTAPTGAKKSAPAPAKK